MAACIPILTTPSFFFALDYEKANPHQTVSGLNSKRSVVHVEVSISPQVGLLSDSSLVLVEFVVLPPLVDRVPRKHHPLAVDI